jgi:ketosteroid isomerase-like protein
VDVIRRLNEAIRRGDWDAVGDCYDPHIFARTDPRWPERYAYGRESAVNFVRGALDSLGADVSQEEIVDLGDRLLVRVRWKTHARHSGIEEELEFSEILTFRDGRVILSEFFLEHANALKALGMSE